MQNLMNTHRGDHWITEMFEYLSVFSFGCLGHLANWSWLWNMHILLYINRGSSKPPIRLERHPSCSICYKGSNKQIHCNSPIFIVLNQFKCICCLRFGSGSLRLTMLWISKKEKKKRQRWQQWVRRWPFNVHAHCRQVWRVVQVPAGMKQLPHQLAHLRYSHSKNKERKRKYIKTRKIKSSYEETTWQWYQVCFSLLCKFSSLLCKHFFLAKP